MSKSPMRPDLPLNYVITINWSSLYTETVDPLSGEGERQWLSTLGPMAFTLARHLIRDGGGEYVARELAAQFGPSAGAKRIYASLQRLQRFGLATVHPHVEGEPRRVSVEGVWRRHRVQS